jgi:coenzyme Q-binding protein COQ10
MPISETIERILPFRPEQLFEIASDVERYPEFVPGWIAVRIRDRHAGGYCTDQILGLGPLRLQFKSKTLLVPPRRIEVASDDAAFRQFGIGWRFADVEGACQVTLSLDLELRSGFSQAVLDRLRPDIAGGIMSAFEARASQLR